jgi:hypothetical protein
MGEMCGKCVGVDLLWGNLINKNLRFTEKKNSLYLNI